MPYGRSVSPTVIGPPLEVSNDGEPRWKTGGITVDWTTVAAVANAAVTYPDGTVVPVGSKGLRLGQVLTIIGTAEVQTVVIAGTPTGGSFTLTLPASGDQAAQTTAAIPYNATQQQVQDALCALSRIGANGVFNVQTGTTPNFTNTLTFARRLGDIGQLTATDSTTGGTHSVTPGTSTPGTPSGASGGKYGPYDPAATDGRQTLERGSVFILNRTAVKDGLNPIIPVNADNPAVISGGRVTKALVLATTGTHSLAAGPTFTELEAALPLLEWVSE